MTVDAARSLWTLIEPYHAVVYFGRDMRQAYADVGLTGFWRGYFAGRAAPMGAVEAGVVTACFFGFHPDFVSRAIPDVWNRATPAEALAARLEGVHRTLDHLGIADEGHACSEAASLLRGAMEDCSAAGRPMFAANADLPWPDEPHLALWHAATLLREHRGDGHVTALVHAGVGPCEAHILRIAVDGSDPGTIRPHRGWSEDDWEAATDRLRSRGWLDAQARPTGDGRRRHAEIEAHTDDLAAEPVDNLGADVERLVELMSSLTSPLLSSGLIPYPNAMGVPRPPYS